MALALRTIARNILRGKGAGFLSSSRTSTAVRRNAGSDVGAASGDQRSGPTSWRLGKLNHVAIAVPDLEKAASMYRDMLGANVSKVVPLPEHGVYTVFIDLGNTKIELLHPLGDKSPIESFLKKKPDGGLHHVCLEVDDIEKAIDSLEGKVRPLNPVPKIGAHGKPVVFLHPKDCDGVLIELEQV